MKRILAMIGVGIALVAFSFVVDGAASGASDATSSTANPQGSSGSTDPCGCQTSSDPSGSWSNGISTGSPSDTTWNKTGNPTTSPADTTWNNKWDKTWHKKHPGNTSGTTPPCSCETPPAGPPSDTPTPCSCETGPTPPPSDTPTQCSCETSTTPPPNQQQLPYTGNSGTTGNSGASAGAQSGEPTVVAATNQPVTTSPAPVPAATATTPATSLPFTGVDVKPFLFSGLTLIALGLSLLARRRIGAHSRRKYRHQMRSSVS
jgi:hypothetical protein